MSFEDEDKQARARTLHSQSESRRRQAINDAIDSLRSKVGASTLESKAVVLGMAVRRFERLELECIGLRTDNQRLTLENTVLRIKMGDYSNDLASLTLPPLVDVGSRRSLPHITSLSLGRASSSASGGANSGSSASLSQPLSREANAASSSSAGWSSFAPSGSSGSASSSNVLPAPDYRFPSSAPGSTWPRPDAKVKAPQSMYTLSGDGHW